MGFSLGGVFHAVTHPADTLHDVGHAITHPADTLGSLAHTAGDAITHPADTLATVATVGTGPVGILAGAAGVPNPIGNPIDTFFKSGPAGLGQIFSHPNPASILTGGVGSLPGISSLPGIGNVAGGLPGVPHGIDDIASGIGGMVGGAAGGMAGGVPGVPHSFTDLTGGGIAGGIPSLDPKLTPGGFFQHDLENRLGIPFTQFQHDPRQMMADQMGHLIHQPLGAFHADPGVFIAQNIGYSMHQPLGDIVRDPQGFFTHNVGYSTGLPLTDFAHDPQGTFLHAFTSMAGGPGFAPEYPVRNLGPAGDHVGSTSAALSHGVDMPLVNGHGAPYVPSAQTTDLHSYAMTHGFAPPSIAHQNSWAPVSHIAAAQDGPPLPPWLEHVATAPTYTVPSPWDHGPGGSWGANYDHPLHQGYDPNGWMHARSDMDHDGVPDFRDNDHGFGGDADHNGVLDAYDDFHEHPADTGASGVHPGGFGDDHRGLDSGNGADHQFNDHLTVNIVIDRDDHADAGHHSAPVQDHDTHNTWAQSSSSSGADADEFSEHDDHASSDVHVTVSYQPPEHDSDDSHDSHSSDSHDDHAQDSHDDSGSDHGGHDDHDDHDG